MSFSYAIAGSVALWMVMSVSQPHNISPGWWLTIGRIISNILYRCSWSPQDESQHFDDPLTVPLVPPWGWHLSDTHIIMMNITTQYIYFNLFKSDYSLCYKLLAKCLDRIVKRLPEIIFLSLRTGDRSWWWLQKPHETSFILFWGMVWHGIQYVLFWIIENISLLDNLQADLRWKRAFWPHLQHCLLSRTVPK